MQARRAARPLVVTDEAADEEAVSWWACSVAARAMGSTPPLVVGSFEHAAASIAATGEPVLLTPQQAQRLGIIGELSPLGADVTVRHFAHEYVYGCSALASRADRSFRKACRRAESAMAERSLRVEAFPGCRVSAELIASCVSCREGWMRRRADDARRAARPAGERYLGPPWAGAPRRSSYLLALLERQEGPSPEDPPGYGVALFVIRSGAADQVAAYVVTERVGRTVVAVDGVHDYSLPDPRADPSALLLHVAARWWREQGVHEGGSVGVPPPLFLNDGPVPTAGLLKYKSQYHGRLLATLSVWPGRAARARSRWSNLLRLWQRRRAKADPSRHCGPSQIRRAARRMYCAKAAGLADLAPQRAQCLAAMIR